MYTHSLFDSFFAPTRVIVVSEERLKAAELKAKREQLEALDTRIKDLTSYRESLTKEIEEADQPQSLEEALTGG